MNKANGGDEIPAELFQILKDDAVKSAALNMSANLENSVMATIFNSSPKEWQWQRVFKLCTIVFILHDSKVMLKILQARHQQCVH